MQGNALSGIPSASVSFPQLIPSPAKPALQVQRYLPGWLLLHEARTLQLCVLSSQGFEAMHSAGEGRMIHGKEYN